MSRFALSSLPVTLRQMVRVRRMGQVALACSTLALLSACGGGDRAEEFKPDRVVALGDENSAFAADVTIGSGKIEGLVYTVNALVSNDLFGYCPDDATTAPCADGTFRDLSGKFEVTFTGDPTGTPTLVSAGFVRLVTPGTLTYKDTAAGSFIPAINVKRDRFIAYQCNSSVTVVQRIAHTFGKGFGDNCAADGSGAKSYASHGKRIADLQAQVNQGIGEGQIGKGALVTVWIGQNDIMAVAESTTQVTPEAKRIEVKQRADKLAQVVMQIIRTGAKVVVIGAPDIGYSPWAASRDAATIKQLVLDFNSTLKVGDKSGLKGLQDYTDRGRDYTFVDAGDIVRAHVNTASFVNARVCPDAADTAGATPKALRPSLKPDGTLAERDSTTNEFPVEFCTAGTLLTGASLGTHLWADEFRVAPVLHEAIANAALVRVVNQF